MNAAVYAYHHMLGGKDAARQGLHDFWQRISQAGDKTRNPFDAILGVNNLGLLSTQSMFETMTRLLSPYEFNPFNLNPLKDVLNGFDRLRSGLHHCENHQSAHLHNQRANWGKMKIFDNDEITSDVILASACLPFLFQAVAIEGEHYWDGGYMGNPAIYPMFTGVGEQRCHHRPCQSDRASRSAAGARRGS